MEYKYTSRSITDTMELAENIESDECMPKEDKLAAMNAIHELNELLWKYSY